MHFSIVERILQEWNNDPIARIRWSLCNSTRKQDLTSPLSKHPGLAQAPASRDQGKLRSFATTPFRFGKSACVLAQSLACARLFSFYENQCKFAQTATHNSPKCSVDENPECTGIHSVSAVGTTFHFGIKISAANNVIKANTVNRMLQP